MISVVIPVYNEDITKIRHTVASLKNTLLLNTKIEILVIDDCSDSPVSLDIDDTTVIRNEDGIGAMQSINKGLSIAKGDVLFSCDSHMNFISNGTLELVAEKALESRCIATLPSCSYNGSGELHGCHLHWNRNHGLQPRWRDNWENDDYWEQVPCMMGASYAMSRETMMELKGSTGHVWDNIKGRWGFGEQSMAVKCYLMNIPIYIAKDHKTGHKYRSKNPLANTGMSVTKENWANICYTLSLYLEPKVFDRRLKPIVDRHINSKKMKYLIEDARENRPNFTETQKVFTHLLGYKPNIDRPHHDYQWLSVAKTKLDMLEPKTIVVYRPNEVVFDLVDRFPNAVIHVKDFSKQRHRTWRFILGKLDNVEWHKCSIKDYPEPPVDQSDLTFICGDFKEECREQSEAITNGPIIVSNTNMRDQLDERQRKKEQRVVDQYKDK